MRNERNARKSRMVAEIKDKQRNIVFPDTVRNSRNVDAFLWKGSPDAPLVQRMGAWIIGLFFLGWGFCFLYMGYREPSLPIFFYSTVGLVLGGKIFLNGFRRHREAGGPGGGDEK